MGCETQHMFGWFQRDPLPRLQSEYETLLERARDLQRGGDIKGYAYLTAEAEEVAKRIDALRREREKGQPAGSR